MIQTFYFIIYVQNKYFPLKINFTEIYTVNELILHVCLDEFDHICVTTTLLKIYNVSISAKIVSFSLCSQLLLQQIQTTSDVFYRTTDQIFFFYSFIQVESQSMYTFVSLLLLSILFWRYYIHVTCICSLFPLWLNNIPWFEQTTFYLSIHMLLDIWIASSFGL